MTNIPDWMQNDDTPSWAKDVVTRLAAAFAGADIEPIEVGPSIFPGRNEGAKEELVFEGSLGQITFYQHPETGVLTIVNDYAHPCEQRGDLDEANSNRDYARSVRPTWEALVKEVRRVYSDLRVRADFDPILC